jgi:radical SAM protein with 4Fe4S-binding SPASM domain
MTRNLVLGNVKDDTIVNILRNSDYEVYKKLTKDNVEKCKDCEFRFGCLDCRAVEMDATGKLHGLEFCNK